MKKTIAKTAALAMAVMLAGSAISPIAASALSGAISATSNESEADMKEALTKVKQRVTVPDELSEFSYSTSKSYGTKTFSFIWHTPDSAKKYREISVSAVGDIIISYNASDSGKGWYSSEPSFAELTEKEILAKAESYIKQLDPKIAGEIKAEVNSLSLFGNTATVTFYRYVNGVKIVSNNGSVRLDKNTGELYDFSANWWDNADFSDPKTARSETEIRADYKALCTLTPYYKITADRETQKKTARIVYEPDFNSEIDAYTGKASSIWTDMRNAEGTRFYGYDIYENITEDADCIDAADAGGNGGVVFTAAELKKIRQDNNLITAEKAFELLKKDKYAALTDDYAISSYEVYSDKQSYGAAPLAEDSSADQKEEKEKFYLSVRFTVKDELKNNYKGYKTVYVQLNAETGEMLNMQKSGGPGGLPVLDVKKANKIADSAAKTYAKDIIGGYKAAESNTAPVRTWGSRVSPDGSEEEIGETARDFIYDRYVNGIGVYGDSVRVTVDSMGVVTGYSFNHTEDVKFPSADILTPDEAFEKLFKQKKFDYYYDGWIAKDGKVKTYLLYKMNGFYLNAKTGKLCSWNGEALNERVPANEVKYSDVKGIPQEQAILTLQKYGVVLTSESKFAPKEYITEQDFMNLLSNALNSDVRVYSSSDEWDETSKRALTKEQAAVVFTEAYDRNGISKLKGIFKTPYSDIKSSDENAGAIAVAYAKGFFGKGDGKFNGGKKITRAEAMQLVYDYIKLISDKQK